MYDGHNSAHNIGSEHASNVPNIQSETMESDMSSGAHTNHELHQDARVELQQNRTQEQVLPTSNTLHNTINYNYSFTYPNVHTDVTIDHVVPPIAAKGNTATASPISSTHNIVGEAPPHLDSLVHLADASTTGTIHPQAATANMTIPIANVYSHPDKQVTDKESRPPQMMHLALFFYSLAHKLRSSIVQTLL
ncbi:uncharacterized protein [Setaria viridis]|uniref:uncharacterized protein isoform X2 n=1 Tax=Setaria viridis TaxID=4556 RepID=UPI003B3B42EC